MNYKNKIVVITGASRGIGKETAYYFAKQGASLILTYNTNKDLLENIVFDIKNKYNISVDGIKCDLTSELEIENLYNFIKDKYQQVDILINNAALSLDDDFIDKTKCCISRPSSPGVYQMHKN